MKRKHLFIAILAVSFYLYLSVFSKGQEVLLPQKARNILEMQFDKTFVNSVKIKAGKEGQEILDYIEKQTKHKYLYAISCHNIYLSDVVDFNQCKNIAWLATKFVIIQELTKEKICYVNSKEIIIIGNNPILMILSAEMAKKVLQICRKGAI